MQVSVPFEQPWMMYNPMSDTFEQRLEKVELRIAAACERAGRPRDSVRLLAVSKTKPPEAIREAADCGLRLFGENKVQEAQSKIPMCPAGLEWHLIGHLQSNKAKVAANLFQMIHSVDSQKLLQALEAHAATALPVLLQVNVSNEVSKSGMMPGEVAEVIEDANRMQKVEVHGLMSIPPFTADPEKARAHFSALRELRDRMQEETGTPLPELSMGMSHDLEVAIEEGSTWVRIGTDLFGSRN
jgi:pyridoxal phosphate enzyme (YggS family)